MVHQAFLECDSLCAGVLNNNTQIITFIKVTHYIHFQPYSYFPINLNFCMFIYMNIYVYLLTISLNKMKIENLFLFWDRILEVNNLVAKFLYSSFFASLSSYSSDAPNHFTRSIFTFTFLNLLQFLSLPS